ncbi:hypothetical protein MY494_03250 [Synechococcus sp. A10-1-5-1]|uniref:hypothetical protein n=1 Tax=Synechococcus sp. A10-1-5-1 TaxID=2936507 RepID=UPI002001C136|nr:hypothetical protein [Synechococcus sp. A10-1-5-1]UPM50815.1 hypothetical protein MY494_03250 [Synechococcus sp. A10-1-5-1]
MDALSRMDGMALPRLGAVALVLVLMSGCSGRNQKDTPKKDSEAQRQALVQCRRYRESLPPLVERYRATESRLKAIEAESFTQAMAPLPLDPEEQRLLTIYDQQTEQEQYEQAVAEWQRSETKRRLVWQDAQQQRQAAAVTERDQLADQLRTIHPALLTQAKPPSLDSAELERFLACSPERLR